MLPFPINLEKLSGTHAYAKFLEGFAKPKLNRELAGDGFRSDNRRGRQKKPPAAFKSLFQGDHLGVEFALRSHEVL